MREVSVGDKIEVRRVERTIHGFKEQWFPATVVKVMGFAITAHFDDNTRMLLNMTSNGWRKPATARRT